MFVHASAPLQRRDLAKERVRMASALRFAPLVELNYTFLQPFVFFREITDAHFSILSPSDCCAETDRRRSRHDGRAVRRTSQRLAQMMAHCSATLEMASGKFVAKRTLLGRIRSGFSCSMRLTSSPRLNRGIRTAASTTYLLLRRVPASQSGLTAPHLHRLHIGLVHP